MTWHPTAVDSGPHGETCIKYECAEHPRVYRLVQTDAEGVVRDLYYVTGIVSQHYHTAEDAIRASEVNTA